MPREWLADNLPVISTQSGHTLYTRLTACLPRGKSLTCPGDCKQELRVRNHSKGSVVICSKCSRRCTVPLVDKTTFLEQRGILKTSFPLSPFSAEWRPGKPKSQSDGPHTVTPPPKPLEASPASSYVGETLPRPAPAPVVLLSPPVPGLRHSRSTENPTTPLLKHNPGSVMPRKRRSVNDMLELYKKRRK